MASELKEEQSGAGAVSPGLSHKPAHMLDRCLFYFCPLLGKFTGQLAKSAFWPEVGRSFSYCPHWQDSRRERRDAAEEPLLCMSILSLYRDQLCVLGVEESCQDLIMREAVKDRQL